MLIEQGAKIFGLEEKFHFFFLMYILYHFLNFLSSILTLNLPIWRNSTDTVSRRPVGTSIHT